MLVPLSTIPENLIKIPFANYFSSKNSQLSLLKVNSSLKFV